MLGRRRMLALMGGLGLGAVSGLPAAALEACTTALPWETAGPYPADGTNTKAGQTVNALQQEGVLRTDITTSFGDYEGSVEGVPLELELTLMDIDGCTPLAGHAIYIWHCDGGGKYSLYDDTDVNWLRGLGVADDEGKVRFTTIVPGCYDGRWPHIHFEVFESVEKAVSGEASLLTAQIAVPETESALVYQQDAGNYPNATRNLGRISIPSDNVFRDNSDEEIEQQTLAMTGDVESGFIGKVTIPIDFDADRSVSMPAPPPGGMGMPPKRD
jgi:protocatechuate 3,4-dioxygenase beta subunit